MPPFLGRNICVNLVCRPSTPNRQAPRLNVTNAGLPVFKGIPLTPLWRHDFSACRHCSTKLVCSSKGMLPLPLSRCCWWRRRACLPPGAGSGRRFTSHHVTLHYLSDWRVGVPDTGYIQWQSNTRFEVTFHKVLTNLYLATGLWCEFELI